MQKRIALSILLLAATLSVAAMSTLDSLFIMLDQDVNQSGHYSALHQQRIDSLKAIHPMTKALQLRIAREYQYYQSDSACAWYLRLLDCEEPYRTQAYMGLVQLSYSIGKYGDGMVLLSEMQSVPDSLRVDWLEAVWRLHTEAAASSRIPKMRDQLLQTAQQYYDSLLHEMARQASGNTDIRLRYEILNAMDADDIPLALRINDTILMRAGEWTHRYAIEAYSRAILYQRMGEGRQYIEWLTRSAIADVRCGIMDNGSSWLVAKECFE
ncbi:MAG: hypothetical protein II448_02190 [Paludibacteraceae bacterium]|nr:hypothetical protein [Paludibacteraceae bacterium]